MDTNITSKTGYLEGNIEQWAPTLNAKVPKIASLLFKTIDPLICGALIGLLGNSALYKKKEGIIAPIISNKQTQAFQVRLSFFVSSFIGFTGSQEAIKKDASYILKQLRDNVPILSWPDTAVQIIPSKGMITIFFNIPVGAV